MTIKAAQTVDFLLHVAKMRKHLAAACGTDELFVRGPGAIAEMRRENYASFLGTDDTLGPMTDKLVANSERLFVAFFDGHTTWSAGVEM